jgi:hypothetical protein
VRGIARSFLFFRQVWFGQGKRKSCFERIGKLHVFFANIRVCARRRRRKTKKKQDNKLVFQILSFLVSFKFFVHSLKQDNEPCVSIAFLFLFFFFNPSFRFRFSLNFSSDSLDRCFSIKKSWGGIYIRELRRR